MSRTKELTQLQQIKVEKAREIHQQIADVNKAVERRIREEIKVETEKLKKAREIAILAALDEGLTQNRLRVELSCDKNLVPSIVKEHNYIREVGLSSQESNSIQFEIVKRPFGGIGPDTWVQATVDIPEFEMRPGDEGKTIRITGKYFWDVGDSFWRTNQKYVQWAGDRGLLYSLEDAGRHPNFYALLRKAVEIWAPEGSDNRKLMRGER